MTVKQLSVFVENKQGKLGEVLHVLGDQGVNILSISLADTSEYGLIRLIVDRPEEGRNALIDAGFSSMLADVLVIKVPHVSGGLRKVLELLVYKNVNVEYTYCLTAAGNEASIVVKTNELDAAIGVLGSAGIELISADALASK